MGEKVGFFVTAVGLAGMLITGTLAKESGTRPSVLDPQYDAAPKSCPCCALIVSQAGHSPVSTAVIVNEFMALSKTTAKTSERNHVLAIGISDATDRDGLSYLPMLDWKTPWLKSPYSDPQGRRLDEITAWLTEFPMTAAIEASERSIGVCPILADNSFKVQVPQKAVVKGWLPREFHFQSENDRSAALKNFNATLLPMDHCGNYSEARYTCTDVDVKEIHCLAGQNNPVFTFRGELLGFIDADDNPMCGDRTGLSLITKVSPYAKWITEVHRQARKGA